MKILKKKVMLFVIVHIGALFLEMMQLWCGIIIFFFEKHKFGNKYESNFGVMDEDYEINNGEHYFCIKEFEVFQIIFESVLCKWKYCIIFFMINITL